jgi:general secretion pathway protein M
MKALSPIAALAILLAGLFVVVSVTLLPLLAGDAEAEGAEEAIRRYEAIAAGRDALRQSLASLPPAPGDSAGRLPQTTDALALAELQSRLSALAAEAGVAVTAAEPLAAEEGGDPVRVQLSLDLTGPLAGIQALLHRVESGQPVMAVTRLDLSSRPDRNLSARLTIAAWRSTS